MTKGCALPGETSQRQPLRAWFGRSQWGDSVRGDVVVGSGDDLRSFVRSHSGSNAVEFALIAPILCLLLLGTTFLAIYLGTAHSLAQIAADTSRYAMVGQDTSERRVLAGRWVQQTAQGYPLIKLSNLSLTTVEESDMFEVALTYDISYLPIPDLVRSNLPLASTIRRTSTVLVP